VVDEDQLLFGGIAGQQLQQRHLLAAGAESRPALRQPPPHRVVARAGLQSARWLRLPRQARTRPRRASWWQHQAVAALAAVGGKGPAQIRQLAIGRQLAGRGVDAAGGGVAARQLQRHDRAGVADLASRISRGARSEFAG